MAKTTIHDVARLAKVSPSAVSIVLNNRPGVSDATRKSVMEIVEQLGYAPNPNSRRLLFKKTNNIAILFPRSTSPLEHSFYSEINTAVLRECEINGYNLIFSSFSAKNDKVQFPDLIKACDVDGVIFYGDVNPTVLNALAKYELPHIIIDNHTLLPDVLCVSADYHHASQVAVKYLMELGHREIAYIGNSAQTDFGAQTLSGYQKALAAGKISVPEAWQQCDAFCENSAYQCMEKILACPQRPTAIACGADIYAIGAIQCIKDHGFKVPEDFSVAGIDDILLSRYTDPTITTVKIDKGEIGKTAVQLLIQAIDGESVSGIVIQSDQLIPRKSTKEYSKQ